MTKWIWSLWFVLTAAAPALAQDGGVAPPTPVPPTPPTQAVPTTVPPPPSPPESEAPPPEPNTPAPVAPAPGVPAGQWVYTAQYGWVWMPYEQQYTYVPAYGDPYMFVYFSTGGWRWVMAPWVFGWGPHPFWGPWGVRHFAWYAHPWFRAGEFRGHPGMHRYGGPAPRFHGHPGGRFGGHGRR